MVMVSCLPDDDRGVDFDDDEELIGISGTVGTRVGHELISSLSFVTNKKYYGSFGDEKKWDTHFSESWDLGLFDGFYGRYGWYLDAVGCCLKNII
ncbi:hypothetical protein L1987_35135 [Smallanthus sonchifolius]|uniref:Uncharacterized protein n=1 Tax=Smallanthus sonchifolius TaxID=185202 RepID=A0ACB9HX01_9ASTR|nr:hypothetical protein L1987_35135 [Smallanthus sonchifolius]